LDSNSNSLVQPLTIIEDNLPSVEAALEDLKTAWNESLQAEEKFKTVLKNYI